MGMLTLLTRHQGLNLVIAIVLYSWTLSCVQAANVCNVTTSAECKNGGTCAQDAKVNNETRCTCVGSFQGDTCEEESCTNPATCSANGTVYCSKTGNTTKVDTCKCKDHFWDVTCDKQSVCLTETEHCKNKSVCQTNGTTGAVTCDCTNTTFSGPTCSDEKCTSPEVCSAEGTLYCFKSAPSSNATSTNATSTNATSTNSTSTDATSTNATSTNSTTSTTNATTVDTCKCKEHYYDVKCDKKSQCLSNATYCQIGEVCKTDVTGNATCSKNTPSKCSDTANPYCKNGGICKAVDGKDICTCVNGFHGDICDKDPAVCDDVNRCKNNGVCTRVNGTDTCGCKYSWFGPTCETAPCKDPSKCKNGGICVIVAGNETCNCTSAWSGDTCTTDVDECKLTGDAAVCKNNGTCTNTDGAFSCNCTAGFSGKICDQGHPCKLNPKICGDHGTCGIVTDLVYNCTCSNGYEGVSCNLGPCHPSRKMCANSANCTETSAAPFYNCTCNGGWTGDKCDTDKDECAATPNPCKNAFKCLNTPGSYSCGCKPGWTAIDCSENINECTATDVNKNHCDINATCTDTPGSYTCKCNDGLLGNGMAGQCQPPMLLTLNNATTFAATDKSKTVVVDYGIPIGQGVLRNNFDTSLERSFTVNKNGYISIGWTRDILIASESDSKGFKMLAPYMTALENGTVKYSVYTPDNNNSAELPGLVTKLKDWFNPLVADFKPIWLLIAEWADVTPPGSANEKATFQAVIASDAVRTLAAILHQPGGNSWAKDTDARRIFIGFSDGSNVTSSPGSLSRTASSIDTAKGSKDQPGLFVFDAGKIAGTTNNELSCVQWTNANKDKKVTAFTTCPFVYQQIGMLRTFREDNGCFYQKFADNKVKMSCCYAISGDGDLKNGPVLPGYTADLTGLPDVEGVNATEMRATADSCCQKSSLCKSFSNLFPPSGAKDFKPPSLAMANGDPHLTTFDGRVYTFNGQGEYVLAQTKATATAVPKIEIQARTDVPSAGINATVFTAFVMRQLNSSVVQVELSMPNKDAMKITVMKVPNADATKEESWTVEDFTKLNTTGEDMTLVSLSKAADGKTLSVAFQNGFEFKISVGVKMLVIMTVAPISYQKSPGLLEGLMGDFDGKKDNDFVPRAATAALPDTTSEKDLYEKFGKTWAIAKAEDSFFKYQDGNTFKGHNATFTPLFLSDYDTDDKWKALLGDLYVNANVTCSKGGNFTDALYQACMYDIGLTKDLNVGTATVADGQVLVTNQTTLANTPPVFKMNSTQLVFKLNQSTDVDVVVQDSDANDTVTVTFNGTPPDKFSLTPATTPPTSTATLKLTWTPTDLTPHKFELLAKDNRGGSVLQPLQIRIDQCVNNGTAKFDYLDAENAPTNPENFYVGVCSCVGDYGGSSCEVDPCQRVPSLCFPGVGCTVDATMKVKCAACPNGTIGDGVMCTDVDECQKDNGGCEVKCVNSFGSFVCTCPVGYAIDATDNKKCADINECLDTLLNDCNPSRNLQCQNKAGTFECVCKEGYLKSADGNCTDIDECDPAKPTNDCDAKTATCSNTVGSFNCTCKSGYNGDGRSCVDINECLNPNTYDCTQICKNTDGAYTCDCNAGYILKDDKKTCDVNPANKCDATHICAQFCTKVDGKNVCSCDKKMTLQPDGLACLPKNYTEFCPALACGQNCVDDGKGGAKCSCQPGYAPKADMRTCEDIDECKNPNLSKCAPVGSSCNNSVGGFTCKCNDGFSGDGTTCTDIDECLASPCDPNAICVDQLGVPTNKADSCFCKPTYGGDGLKCEKAGKSMLVSVTYTMVYVPEYRDIRSQRSRLFINQIMAMLEFGFKKKYGDKYMGLIVIALREGSTITDANANFKPDAVVDPNSLSSAVQDVMTKDANGNCKMGALDVKCDVTAADFNECEAGPDINKCPASTNCQNNDGGFACVCRSGYTKSGVVGNIEQCTDIDECQTNCTRPGTNCTNLMGSYICECFAPNFSEKPETDPCISSCDPNPCSNSGTCSYNRASPGYTCQCPDHYQGPTCTVMNPKYEEMRTVAIVIGVLFGLLIIILLIILFFVCKKRRKNRSAAWTVQGDKYRRKGSQPVHKTVGADGRPVLLDDYETGSIPRAKRDPERQQYEMVENSPNHNKDGVDNPAFENPSYANGQKKKDGEYGNEYF